MTDTLPASDSDWRRLDRTLVSIQYLRGVAGLMVLLSHALPNAPGLLIGLLSTGMDAFFLISGFVVVVIIDETTRPLTFFRHRVERIVPIYWIATLLSFWLISSGILAGQFDPRTQAAHMAYGEVRYLAASLLFIPAVSPSTGLMQPLIGQGWTLNYEMLFYSSFAAVLFLKRQHIVPVLTAAYCCAVVAGGLFAQSDQLRFVTSPLIFEFIAGLWVGIAWRKGWSFIWLGAALLLAWVPLAMATFVFFDGWPLWPQRLVQAPIALAAFLILVSADRHGEGLRSWPSLRLLGDASYSIYLFHFLAIVLAYRFIGTSPDMALAFFSVVFFGGLAAGLAGYFVIERPIVGFFRKRRKSGHS